MTNDNKKTKNNAPCEEKQEARKLSMEELENVNGGGNEPDFGPVPEPDFNHLKDKNISVIVTDIKY